MDLLPTHSTPPPRSNKPSFISKSRISLLITLCLGLFTLFSFYHVSEPPLRSWRYPHPPPPPLNFDPRPQTEDKASAQSLLWRARAEDVKASFLHAWQSYEKHAWGSDELRPVSGNSVQNFNGWGVSIVDSLDTLLIMDLRPQFARAMDHVASMNFTQRPYEVAPFFETTIRYLGGLLSAYALVVDQGTASGITWVPESFPYRQLYPQEAPPDEEDEFSIPPEDELEDEEQLDKRSSESPDHSVERNRIANILLTRADHLARALLPAFNTSSGLPVFGVNTVTGHKKNTWSSLLAEIGSCQMEYKYLAHITGRKEYFDAVNDVTNVLQRLQRKQLDDPSSAIGGMLPTRYQVLTGIPIDQYISVGSLADSAYEYLLKGYLLSGRTEHRLLDMYLASMNTALQNLTYLSPERDLMYITDANGPYPSHRLEHLSCFFPGLLALGVELLSPQEGTSSSPVKIELPKSIRERHLWAAEGIAETCWILYADNPTGLGSDEVYFDRPLVPQERPTTTAAAATQVVAPFHSLTPNNPPPLVHAGPTHNRWWAIVDEWDLNGRPGNGKPRGVQGAERKNIVTNGGKGSWETFTGMPSENERPLVTTTTGGETEGAPPKMQIKQQKLQRTHIRDYSVREGRWLMRPETIESLYLMHRLTKDPIWRDRCYGIYQGMEKYSRTEMGYAATRGVDYDIDPETNLPRGVDINGPRGGRTFNWKGWTRWEDNMPSYALAETFKYLYLCLLDPEESTALLPSNKWIFNTEAHPLPVFDWTESEKTLWDIR